MKIFSAFARFGIVPHGDVVDCWGIILHHAGCDVLLESLDVLLSAETLDTYTWLRTHFVRVFPRQYAAFTMCDGCEQGAQLRLDLLAHLRELVKYSTVASQADVIGLTESPARLMGYCERINMKRELSNCLMMSLTFAEVPAPRSIIAATRMLSMLLYKHKRWPYIFGDTWHHRQVIYRARHAIIRVYGTTWPQFLTDAGICTNHMLGDCDIDAETPTGAYERSCRTYEQRVSDAPLVRLL